MGLTEILRPLAVLWGIMAFAALVTAVAAMALGEGSYASAFGATAALAGLPASLILAATRGLRMSASAVDALGLALLAWITAPLIAAIPFGLSGHANAVDALFEGYSAVTTTGAVLTPPEDLPRVLVFWRALLAWLGGYATLMMAAALFSALDRDAPAIRKSVLLTAQPDNVFSHLRLAALRIAIIYVILTALVGLGLLFSGLSLHGAAVLAMGSLSTSGIQPFSGGLGETLASSAVWFIAMGCLAGAVNISLFWDVLRDRMAIFDPDLAGLGGLFAGLLALYLIARPTGLVEHATDALFVITTSAYTLHGSISAVPLAALFAAMIGGAAASTAGGIKVSRILLLWRRMGAELAKLADPSSVVPVRFRGRSAPDRALVAIWSYPLAFAALLGGGSVLLSFTGINFSQAMEATGAALANAGPLFELSAEGNDWIMLSDLAKLILIPVMILGRLEVLAGLAAIWAIFLRR